MRHERFPGGAAPFPEQPEQPNERDGKEENLLSAEVERVHHELQERTRNLPNLEGQPEFGREPNADELRAAIEKVRKERSLEGEKPEAA